MPLSDVWESFLFSTLGEQPQFPIPLSGSKSGRLIRVERPAGCANPELFPTGISAQGKAREMVQGLAARRPVRK